MPSSIEDYLQYRLIFRYDDTRHHPELEHFPHHKHIGGESEVEGASPPELPRVLSDIESMYPLTSGDT